MYDAASEARKTAAPTSSSGRPKRPSGMRRASSAMHGSAKNGALLSVWKNPGAIALAVMPVPPSSTARARISASSPPSGRRRPDRPVTTSEDAWESLHHMAELGVPAEAQRKLLGENARRLYGIEPVMTVKERIEKYEPAILPW